MSTPKALQNREFRSTSMGRFWEKSVVSVLAVCALITVLITIGIISMLISQSWGFFGSEAVSFRDFIGAANGRRCSRKIWTRPSLEFGR